MLVDLQKYIEPFDVKQSCVCCTIVLRSACRTQLETNGWAQSFVWLGPVVCLFVCLFDTAETQHLDRLGQLGEFEQESNTELAQETTVCPV